MNVRKICCFRGGDLGVMLSVMIAVKCPEIRVTFVDPNPKDIFKWNAKVMLNGNTDRALFDLLRKVQNKNLYFTTNDSDSIREAELIFVITNPEVKDAGEGKGALMNLTSVRDAAQTIVDYSETDKIIVECSCIPLGSSECLKEFFRFNAKPSTSLQVLCSPIFYDRKLGLKSLYHPDRVMIGHDESGETYLAKQVLASIYERWVSPNKIVMKSVWCTELTQIVTYVFIAEKIAGLCTLKAICDKANRPVQKFASQLQKNSKVGGLPDLTLNIGKFCNAIKNLSYICENHNLTAPVEYWKEVLRIFAFEQMYNLEMIIDKLSVPELNVLMFGFSQEDTFLPDLVLKICKICLKRGVTLRVFDPKMTQELINKTLQPLEKDFPASELQAKVVLFGDPITAARGSQVLVIQSYQQAWLEVDFKTIYEEMQKPAYLFDHFRLLLEKELSSIGFQVHEFFPEF